MKIIQVHNWHRYGGGSDAVVEATTSLLRERGHEALLFTRDSGKLGRGLSGRMKAFVCGIYSPSGRSAMRKLLREHKPDIVHVHELYPFISPWALVECKRAGVPVVMTCHDYRLSCPVALHWHNATPCLSCKRGRDYWCVLKNCRGNLFESTGYALRSTVARKLRLFQGNVTRYITPSAFVKALMIEVGFSDETIDVVPNMVTLPEADGDPSQGRYVAYVGRIAPEKGVETLVESAQMTGLPVQLAGDHTPMPDVLKESPPNVTFVGHLHGKDLSSFYHNARFLVIPSVSWEPFGLVIVEAMAQGLPVIASRTGGIPELVDDGVTGLLFEPGNEEDLSGKMRWLWEHNRVSRQMGLAGREKAVREYSDDVYSQRLLAVYETSIRHGATIA